MGTDRANGGATEESPTILVRSGIWAGDQWINGDCRFLVGESEHHRRAAEISLDESAGGPCSAAREPMRHVSRPGGSTTELRNIVCGVADVGNDRLRRTRRPAIIHEKS
ncbi:conserved hypothetical protein [Coccidioides posadasii str. Silveira]|uniref:Uncharacterized protein n=1 Tax=Coccidioides posadasii (strain RMSCC 757 / Silveira) TaxID=443226 RepID=E9DDP1_COCPS|nr:conserved hypothetical protein [Coccidioides posadasii str. Silveira]